MGYRFPPPDWSRLLYGWRTSEALNSGTIAADPTGAGLRITIPSGVASVHPKDGPHVFWAMKDSIYGIRLKGRELFQSLEHIRELSAPSLTSEVITYAGWVDDTDLSAANGIGCAIVYDGSTRNVRVWDLENGTLDADNGGSPTGSLRRVQSSHLLREGGLIGSIRAEGFEADGETFSGDSATSFNTSPADGVDLYWVAGAHVLSSLGSSETVDFSAFGFASLLASGSAPV